MLGKLLLKIPVRLTSISIFKEIKCSKIYQSNLFYILPSTTIRSFNLCLRDVSICTCQGITLPNLLLFTSRTIKPIFSRDKILKVRQLCMF